MDTIALQIVEEIRKYGFPNFFHNVRSEEYTIHFENCATGEMEKGSIGSIMFMDEDSIYIEPDSSDGKSDINLFHIENDKDLNTILDFVKKEVEYYS